jgi:hypothetical protein
MLRNRGGALPSHGGGGGGGGGYDAGGSYGGFAGNGGGYNGGGDHMARSYANKDHRAASSSLLKKLQNPTILSGICAACFFCMSLYYRSSANSILTGLGVANKQQALDLISSLHLEKNKWVKESEGSASQHLDGKRKFSQQLTTLERENKFLQKERDELRVKYEGPDKLEEQHRLELRDEALIEQVELLQAATRRESKRVVLEK